MASTTEGESPEAWSTLPEAVQTGSAPELVVHAYPEVSDKLFSPVFVSPISKYGDSPVVPVQQPTELPTNPARWIWLRRRRNQILLGVIVLVAATATAVGVGVSMTRNRNTDITPPPSPNPNTTQPEAQSIFGLPTTFPTSDQTPSLCRGTVCPQAIASTSTTLTTANTTDNTGTTTTTTTTSSTFLFVLGADSAIWYRQIITLVDSSSSSSVSHAWKTTSWQSLGGSFLSAPSSAEMRPGRVEVFGVWSDGTTRVRTYQNGLWSDTWQTLGGTAGSAPVSCSYGKDNMNVVVVGADHAVHHKYVNGGVNWGPSLEGEWEEQYGWVGSNVDIGCAVTSDDVKRFDMVGYGRGDNNGTSPSSTGEVEGIMFKRFNTTHNWDRRWSVVPGKFRGDPTVVASPTGMDYFGLEDSLAAYHIAWTQEGGVKPLVSLGGKFQSAVAGLYTNQGKRLVIFVVDTDARLRARWRINGQWGGEWEDLGGFFNSAPKPVVLNETALAVFGVGPRGNMIHGVFTMGSGGGLGEGRWFSDGGSFATKWHRPGPA